MKSVILVIAFLCAISAWAADEKPRRNFLEGTFTFDGNIGTDRLESGVIRLEPFIVQSDKNGMDVYDKTQRLMERELSKDSMFRSARFGSKLMYEPPAEQMFSIQGTDDSKYQLSKDEAILDMGGLKISDNRYFYFHGGLMHKIDSKRSIGIKSSHGIKLVLQRPWPNSLRELFFLN